MTAEPNGFCVSCSSAPAVSTGPPPNGPSTCTSGEPAQEDRRPPAGAAAYRVRRRLQAEAVVRGELRHTAAQEAARTADHHLGHRPLLGWRRRGWRCRRRLAPSRRSRDRSSPTTRTSSGSSADTPPPTRAGRASRTPVRRLSAATGRRIALTTADRRPDHQLRQVPHRPAARGRRHRRPPAHRHLLGARGPAQWRRPARRGALPADASGAGSAGQAGDCAAEVRRAQQHRHHDHLDAER